MLAKIRLFLLTQDDWLKKVALLCFAYGICSGFYNTNDSFILHNILTDPTDQLLGSMVYLIIGAWFGTALYLIYGTIAGRWMSKEFKGWKRPTRAVFESTLKAGAAAGIATFFFLWGLNVTDSGTATTLNSASIFFVALIDAYYKKVRFSHIIGPVLLTILGVLLTSSVFAGGPHISIEAILIVFVGRNIFDTACNHFTQEGKDLTDSVNFVLLRFVWLATFGSLLALLLGLATNRLEAMKLLVTGNFSEALPFILLTMIFVACSITWDVEARKNGGEMSIVTILENSKVIFAVLFVYIGDLLWTGKFGDIRWDAQSLMLKGTGVFVVLVSVGLLTWIDYKEKREKEEENRKLAAHTEI